MRIMVKRKKKIRIRLNANSISLLYTAGIYTAIIGCVYGAFCIHPSVGIICLGAAMASMAMVYSNKLKKTAAKGKEAANEN